MKEQKSKGKGKTQERYDRNLEKLAQAKMAFEMANTETYNKMVELAQDKQKHINPIVAKFMRLNTQFFRKTFQAFSACKSIDVNSMKDYAKLAKEQKEMGGKDMHLNKMKIFEK